VETGPLAIFILNLLVGAILLTAGRHFFWLFVGCIGFAAGLQYAPGLWDITSPVLLILLSIVTGIVGALLAVVFQKIAIGLAGFAGGGFMAVNLLRFMDLESETLFWLSYIVGGIIGATLLFMVFEWALIIVSSFAGAMVITQTVNLNPRMTPWGLISLFVFGIVVQTFLFLRARNATKQRKRQIPRTTQPNDS
jgi:hypothetical protein